MKKIINQEFGGERPLYCEQSLRLEHVTIHAGESALKETADIEAEECRFEGKYPFWECREFKVKNCLFTEGARAALALRQRSAGRCADRKWRLPFHAFARHQGEWPQTSWQLFLPVTFEPDADLAFEYSEVQADVRGAVTSVKNPRSGRIVADSYGEIILDANIKAPGDCRIETR